MPGFLLGPQTIMSVSEPAVSIDLTDDQIAEMRAKALEWTGTELAELRGGPLDGLEVAWPGKARYLAMCCATDRGPVEALYDVSEGVGAFKGLKYVAERAE